ncbi:hypothetical protein X751_28270 [Mesorhizobium sp. LNJC395A00]|nr:hypothetical protein X751_28270 [Mesorhizobium sp. LNJC395A00]
MPHTKSRFLVLKCSAIFFFNHEFSILRSNKRQTSTFLQFSVEARNDMPR